MIELLQKNLMIKTYMKNNLLRYFRIIQLFFVYLEKSNEDPRQNKFSKQNFYFFLSAL